MRYLMRATLALVFSLCLFLMPRAAHASVGGAVGSVVVSVLTSPTVIADIILGLFLGAAMIYRAIHAKEANALEAEKAFESKFRSYAHIAFGWVNNLKAMGLTIPGGDKTSAAIAKLDELLQRDGYTLTDDLKELATDIWGAMHGEEKAFAAAAVMVPAIAGAVTGIAAAPASTAAPAQPSPVPANP